MLHSSRAIIQQFKEVEEAMTQFKGVRGGKLNVAVISAGDYFFPRLLVEFARRHSGVTLNFGVCNREELLDQLTGNLTDLAIMVRPPLDMDTVNEPFAPHPYVIVAAPDHPLASRQAHPGGAAGARAVHRAREGLGHLELDAGGFRRAPGRASTSRWRSRAPRPSSRR